MIPATNGIFLLAKGHNSSVNEQIMVIGHSKQVLATSNQYKKYCQDTCIQQNKIGAQVKVCNSMINEPISISMVSNLNQENQQIYKEPTNIQRVG